MARTFVVAKNPDDASALRYLLRIPVDGSLVLKAREPWPVSARVYCHAFEREWSDDLEIVDEVAVRHCERRGPAIDLVLDRARNNRSQFVFTQVRGRPAIFWQTARVAKRARPGQRVPSRRPLGSEELLIVVDSGEKYGYRFAARPVRTERRRLTSGDYAVAGDDGVVLAAVERKTPENLAATLNDGSLAFQLAELSSIGRAAVVVEGDYAELLREPYASPGWLADLLARIQVRYPVVPIVFAGSRKLAEDWTFRFLAAAWREGATPEHVSTIDS